MIDLLIDGQWGSTGKGKLAAVLAESMPPNSLAVCDFGPNAGHTAVMGDKKMVTHQLPMACWVRKDIDAYIGPGSIINPQLLFKELEESEFPINRLSIHPRACVLNPLVHPQLEKVQLSLLGLSSTLTGTGAAWADKTLRNHGSVAEHNEYLAPLTRVLDVQERARANGYILIESAQGFDLGIDYGQFPFCTHRNITPLAVLERCGFSHPMLDTKLDIYMCLRVLPIRVGHLFQTNAHGALVKTGDSGPCYPDQKELTWQEIGVTPERTTCTNRQRRIFSWSWRQFNKAMLAIRPTTIFLNFANYLMQDELATLVERIKKQCPLSRIPDILIGNGADHSAIYRWH